MDDELGEAGIESALNGSLVDRGKVAQHLLELDVELQAVAYLCEDRGLVLAFACEFLESLQLSASPGSFLGWG